MDNFDSKGKTVKHLIAWALAAVSGLGAMAAAAADMSLSGFGTLGYAKSNQPYKYERFIDDHGSFARDSVVGMQADVKFTESIGATVQGKFARSVKNDASWEPALTWAFVSWRPSDDLLIRLGKQRVPLFLNSENMDVGVTHDFAHLPSEMYSLMPSTDYIGVSLSKSWNPSLGELTLDGYKGSINTKWRTYQRDDIRLPPQYHSDPGASFWPLNVDNSGITLTLLRGDDKYRASLNKSKISPEPGQMFIGYVSLVPAAVVIPEMEQSLGLSPGALAGTLSGSAFTVLPEGLVTHVDLLVYTFGAEIHLPEGYRLSGEVFHRRLLNQVNGVHNNGGYLALFKDVGRWTPYVSYGKIKSRADVLNNYQIANTNANGVTALAPALAPAAAAINASQRVFADGMQVLDQDTVALGTSYRLTPNQKLKFEWARTHVGIASSLVNAPSFGNVSNQNIDVLSFSYNFAF